MKKKTSKLPSEPILQDAKLIEITDPVEQAELDRRCRAAQKTLVADRDEVPKPHPRRRPMSKGS